MLKRFTALDDNDATKLAELKQQISPKTVLLMEHIAEMSVLQRLMTTDRRIAASDEQYGLTGTSSSEHLPGSSLHRSNSVNKDEVLYSSSSSSSLSSSVYRHLRQHRNSWPTNEAAAAAVAKAIRPKVHLLSTTTEETVDENSDEEDLQSGGAEDDTGRRRPSADRQRRLVSRCETRNTGGTHTYAVAKVWYRRWEEHVGAVRGFVAGQALAPGPVEMDTQNDDANLFVHESVWKLLVAWYGVATSHHLDRRHLYFKDEKVFDVCVLSPFSGIVEHRCKQFNRFEEVGYVELQLRRMFSVTPTSRRSRLWISEKTPVPRFRQLLVRSRMLNDCIHRDKIYILALELADLGGGRAAVAWPTGEPGDARGELSRYSDLTGDAADWLDGWTESVRLGVEELEQTVAEQVGLAVCQFSETARSTLAETARRLDECRREADERLRALDTRTAALEAAEKDVIDREEAVEEERSRLEDERQRLDTDEARIREEAARADELSRISVGDSKVRLDVGGSIHTTSTQTLRRYPNSLLGLMFSGKYEQQRSSDGTYFIDRDGAHFRYVLNFLRDGSLDPETLPKDRTSLLEIICEARYYQLDALVDHLDELVRRDSAR